MAYDHLFLFGAPKSGTTWLGQLLNAHPRIICQGEARIHGFGRGLYKLCQQYDEVLKKRLNIVTAINWFPPLTRGEVDALLRCFIDHRMGVIAGSESAIRWVGDKDPDHGLHLDILARLYPRARFIHIIRDGRAVLISTWHHNQRSGDPRPVSSRIDELLPLAAKEWNLRIRKARQYGREALKNRYYELRYEDLLKDAGALLTSLFEFLEVESNPEGVQRCIDAASFETLSGGRKPGEEDNQSFFRKGSAHDWRICLTQTQIEQFNEIAGEMLVGAGYSLNSSQSDT